MFNQPKDRNAPKKAVDEGPAPIRQSGKTRLSSRVEVKEKRPLRVMIFGASSGIAFEFARRFAERGATLTLIARDGEKLKDISADLLVRGAKDVQLCAFPLDDLQGSHDATLEIIRQTKTPDTVLIAHGVLGDQEQMLQNLGELQELYQVNVMSPIGILIALESAMLKKGKGTIAVISSVAGDRGRASNFVYGSTKAAMSSFLSGLRARLSRSKVHVITVKPGMVATAMTAHLPRSGLMADPGLVADDIIAAIALKRDTVYSPWFWRWIMLIIRCLPEFIFKKMKF